MGVCGDRAVGMATGMAMVMAIVCDEAMRMENAMKTLRLSFIFLWSSSRTITSQKLLV